ncbi:hypothetical protein JL721_7859 [Aureococcus anophagefferens]|nr:hypothetical protein JL721_7859 [Aureococcus anophagefferens]
MPPQMVSIGGGGADPRLGMEYMETEELGDGISINRHRYNTEFGHNTCDFVSMEDQSPESVAKLSEALKRQQEDKEAAKWDARDAAAKTRKDEVMWSYEVEDCGAAECNGLYERSDDYGWRNEAPVYVKAKGSPKGCDKVFSLSREEQPVNEARTEFKMGWILGCIDEKKAYFGTLTDGLSIPHEQWQALADDVKSPVPYCRWKSCTDRANDHKVMGNVYFKRGQYHEAIAEYSEGLLYDPVEAATLATLLSNRSECRMRLKDWLEALGDAEDALDALGDDPALTATTAPIVEKAHNRRGKAARELGQLAIAADAYVAALEASAALRKIPNLKKDVAARLALGAKETSDALKEVRALERVAGLVGAKAAAAKGEDLQLLETKKCLDGLAELADAAILDRDAGACARAAKLLDVLAPAIESLQPDLKGALAQQPTPAKMSVLTPKAMGFRMDTARYTKNEWATAQRCAAEAAALLCEHKPSRVAAAKVLKISALVKMLESPNRDVSERGARTLRAVTTDAAARRALDVRAGFRDLLKYAHELVACSGEVARLTLRMRSVDDVAARQRAQEEQRAQSAKAKVARAKARAAGGGARAAAGERTTTKADAILGYPLKQMFKDGATKAEDDDGDEDAEVPARRSTVDWATKLQTDGQELLYYRADHLDKRKVEDAVGALELVAEELEALVADPRRRDEVDGWISALSEDRAWGFLAPLIHGPPPLAEAALRVLAACCLGCPDVGHALVDCMAYRPLLTLDSPRGHEPLRTHVPELYKTSRRARNAAATVLGACGRTAGFNQGVDDDERRSLSTLQALLEAADQDPNAEATVAGAAAAMASVVNYRPERVLLVELRFVENVIVPMWRTATPHGEPRKALSSLLRGMLRDETFMQKLLINFEKRGRVGLFNSLTNELRCEDLGDSAQLFEREANSVDAIWTSSDKKREQLEQDRADDDLRVDAVARCLATALPKRGKFLEFGMTTGLVSSRLKDLVDRSVSIVVADPSDKARLGILDDLKQVGRDPDVKDEEDYVSEVLVNGNVKLVRADARAKALSEFEALKEMGPYDVIYLQNAKDYVVDFEPFFADLAKHLLVKPSGKLCFLEDKDFGFDDASGECVVLQKGRDLFIFGYEDGPGFPLPGSPIPAPRAKKADAMLKGGKEAGLLDLD